MIASSDIPRLAFVPADQPLQGTADSWIDVRPAVGGPTGGFRVGENQ